MPRPSSQKRRPAILATSVAVLFSLGFLLGAQKAKADQYWDGTGGSPTTNGNGGSGTWDLTTTNWVDNTGNNPNVYDPTQISIFSTTGGTVTLNSDISFTTLRFDVNGYTVDPGGGPFKLSAQSTTGTISAGSSVAVTINPQLTGSGTMSFQGNGVITLANTLNDYSGGTTIGSGGSGPTLVISSDTNLGAAGGGITFDGGTLRSTADITTTRSVTLTSAGILAPDVSTTIQLNGTIGGAGALVINGAGTVQLGNVGNTYTGGTVINSGTLVITEDGNLGGASGGISFASTGGTLKTTADITITRSVALNATGTFAPDASTTLTLNGVISGSAALQVNGSGTVQLGNASNSYTGGTNITSGTLIIGADGNLGGSGSNITFSSPGGTLQTTASVGTFRSITLGASAVGTLSPALSTTLEIAGSITGSGGLDLKGDGNVLLDVNTNTYTGPTNIFSGKLAAATTNAFSSSSPVTIGATATLELNGLNQTIASLDGSGTVSTSGGTLTTGGNGGSTTYTGVIQGAGGLTKTGAGTMILTGASTYTGRTTVTGGTLLLDMTAGGLSNASTLVLGGGSGSGIFQLNGVAGQTVIQKLNGLIINAGQDNKIIVNNLGTTTTLDLRGAGGTAGIVHNGGAVDFEIVGGTIGITAAGATALIKTHQANDASGVIGAWATVNGGADLAANDGSDNIVAYSGYTNIAARGAVVPNGAALNVRINTAGTTGPDTLAATTTNINTLTQNTATDSTIDLAGGTLRLGTSGGILITPIGTNLTIGTTSNPGTLTAGGGSTNTAGQITLNNSSSTASVLTINSVIADNGTGVVSVVIAGTKTTAFGNANTYTGATNITSGTLRLDAANAIPSQSGVFVNSGATLDLNNNSTTVGSISDGASGGGTISLGNATLTAGSKNTITTYSGTITGSGSFVKTGPGTLTLSNNNTYSGGTTLNSGTLIANNANALGTGTLTINGGTIGSTTSATSITLGNPLIKIGGDFSVSRTNGADLIFGGTVDLQGGTRTITGVTPGSQIHFSNQISNGGITFTTAAAVGNNASLPYVAFIYDGSTPNTYTGLTTVDGHAILVFEDSSVDGAIQGDILVNGHGSVDYILGGTSNHIKDSATVTVNSPGTAIANGGFVDGFALRGFTETIGTLNGSSAGTVGLGSGTLTISKDGNFAGVIEDGPDGGTGGKLTMAGTGVLVLSGANTYTGATTITSGTIQTGAANVLPSATAVNVAASGTLDMNGFSQKVASISGAGNITMGAGTLTVGATNASSTFSGAISGSGGLTKLGTGTLTLSGTNTYTGPTTITGGKMIVAPAGTTAVLSNLSPLIVGGTTTNDGGFFQLNGITGSPTSQQVNGLTVNAGSNVIAVNNTDLTTTTTLDLGSITRNANGFVDFRAIALNSVLGADAIILTTQANDASGILGAWATVNNGSDLATNQGGKIVGLSSVSGPGGYHDIAATLDTVPDGANLNVRINSAVGPRVNLDTNDIIATHPVTTINTLTQNFTTASTIELGGGTLKLGTDGGILITPNSANLTIGASSNDGVLTATSSSSAPATITLANNSSVGTLTINSAITEAGGGPVSVRLTGTGTTVFAGSNTYTGTTAILTGTLRTDIANAMSSTSPVILNSGATLNLNNNSQAIASINNGANGGGNITLGTAALTIGGTNTDSTFSGIISGTSGSLVKNGTGTLTLSGTNSYTGGTTLNSGRLNVDNNSALGTGTLTINGGTIGTTVAGGVQFGNPVIVGGSFSIATNVDTANAGNQNLKFGGTVDLGSSGPTITGVTPGGQITFLDSVSGTNGVTFTTSPAVSSNTNLNYVAYIYAGPTANTYTGTTTVKGNAILAMQVGTTGAGVIALQGNADIEDKGVLEYIGGSQFNNQIADNATITVNSAGNTITGGIHFDGLELRGASDTIGTLNGNSTGRVGLGDGTLTISIGGTFNGVIENGAFAQTTGGSLVMAGTGTLILGGQNTYFGSTKINSGTIRTTIDNALPAGSAVTVSTGATLDINGHTQQIGSLADGTGGGTVFLGSGTLAAGFDGTSTTFSGAIKDGGFSGGTGGNFFKVGGGTLTLSGANTYTGETLLFAGKIVAGAVNTLPSHSAVVVNTGTTLDLNNNNQSIGSLGDNGNNLGGLVNLGSATLTTGNDNTDSFFSGVIQGTGSVTKVGFGTFSLSGANTYTGGTTLTAGGITVFGSLASTVTANNTTGVTRLVNGGTITATGGASGTAVNALTSSGIWIGDFGTFTGAVKMGVGQNTVVIATGINRTPISAPNGKNDTLRLVGGGLDTLNLAQFSGYEFLDKAGGGQWNLTGTNPFSGGTLVEAGTLNVKGNLVSNTKINLDGALTGTGIVTGNILNYGSVIPGEPTSVITSTNTPGRLTLKGNYRQDPTGSLVIQLDGVDSNQFSQMGISGRAQLAGGLLLRNDGSVVSLKLGQKLTFLTADAGVSGKFATVEGDIPTGTVVVGKVVYDANSVSIQGTQGSFMAVDSDFHLTYNQKAVAHMLDSAAFDKRAAKVIQFLDQRPLKKLPGDFDQIAPEEMASVYRIGVSLSDVQGRNVQRRTADLRAGTSGFSAAGFQTTGSPNYSGGLAGVTGPNGKDDKDSKTIDTETERRWGTFITGVGDFAHVGDSGNARGYDLNTGGVTVGADYKLNSHAAIGVTAGYAGTNANLPDDGRLLVNSGRVGVYGTYYTGGYYADAAVTGGMTNYSTRRSSLEGVAAGSTQGSSMDVFVETGYDWRMDALTIGPTASFQYTYVGIDGFTEHGSLTPLRYAGQHQSSIRTTLGLRAAYDWKLGSVLVRPEMTLAWQHEYGDRSYTIDSALASGAGDAFSVADTPIGRDSLLFGAGVAVLWNPRTSTYLYYDADLLKKEYNSQSVSGGLRMNF